jgi:hypothetical protein
LFSVTDQSRGDLSVENITGWFSDAVKKDGKILLTGMDHLLHRRLTDELIERVEGFHGLRIQDGFRLRTGDLHNSEADEIGSLPNELRIHPEGSGVSKLATYLLELAFSGYDHDSNRGL